MTTPKPYTQSDETSAANPPKEGTADWLKSRGWKQHGYYRLRWIDPIDATIHTLQQARSIEKQREKEQQPCE